MHCDNYNGDHDDEDSGWVKLPLQWVQLLLQVVPNEFMDLLQSFCKTGHVIFCNVFLHTVFKTRDMLQLSQPLCLTQLLAAILSPCKHLKMSSIPVFCIFWRHSALLLTPPFLGLKAPDMIQRFPFLVHPSAHCLAVFAWYTRFLRGTNFRQDKDNLGGQQTSYKRKYVSLAKNCVIWIHFPISRALRTIFAQKWKSWRSD